jgi:hypothetical protein
MPAGFDTACRDTEFYAAFARVKELVANFRANEKFHLPPACHYYGLIPAEIKIVEGVAR